MLAKGDGKDTETVVNALIKHAQELPHELYQLSGIRVRERPDTSAYLTMAGSFGVYPLRCGPRTS